MQLGAIRAAGFGELGNTGDREAGAETSDYSPFRNEASPKLEALSDPEVPHPGGGHDGSEEVTLSLDLSPSSLCYSPVYVPSHVVLRKSLLVSYICSCILDFVVIGIILLNVRMTPCA